MGNLDPTGGAAPATFTRFFRLSPPLGKPYDSLLLPVVWLPSRNLLSSNLSFSLFWTNIENKTGENLLQHPLAIQLESCNSVESITEVLKQQAQAFREFRGGNNKVTTLLRYSVQALHKLSAPVILGEHIGLVRPNTAWVLRSLCLMFLLQPASLVRTIHTCLGVLLSVCVSAIPTN